MAGEVVGDGRGDGFDEVVPVAARRQTGLEATGQRVDVGLERVLDEVVQRGEVVGDRAQRHVGGGGDGAVGDAGNAVTGEYLEGRCHDALLSVRVVSTCPPRCGTHAHSFVKNIRTHRCGQMYVTLGVGARRTVKEVGAKTLRERALARPAR